MGSPFFRTRSAPKANCPAQASLFPPCFPFKRIGLAPSLEAAGSETNSPPFVPVRKRNLLSVPFFPVQVHLMCGLWSALNLCRLFVFLRV